MLTTALQRLVTPVLQDAAYSFKPGTFSNTNTVLFLASNQHAVVPGGVVDYQNLHVLAIIFSLPRLRNSRSVTNALNRKQLGKLTVDGQGRLDYVLELPYTRRTTKAAFAHALNLALLTVMRARWAQRRRTHRRTLPYKETPLC
jgi:hypothetical protein